MQCSEALRGVDEQALAAIQTGEGGFALASWAESFGAGEVDFWLIRD